MKIAICSSDLHAEEALEFAKKLEDLGIIVLVPHFYTHLVGDLEEIDETNQRYVVMGFTHDHLFELSYADVVFVYNPEGDCESDVAIDIGYATALKKPIYALKENPTQLSCGVLFRDICDTPEDLVNAIK